MTEPTLQQDFLDKNGNKISIGDLVTIEIDVIVGERTRTRGRRKDHFSIYKKQQVTGTVRYGEFRGMVTYYFDTPEVEEYETHFFSGCGRTRAEKAANELTTTSHSLSCVMTFDFAKKCEIVAGAKSLTE